MPATLFAELLGEVIFKPILEGAWNLTGRGVLGCVLGSRLLIVPDAPEPALPPRNWKSRKNWQKRQRSLGTLPQDPRAIRVPFSLVTLVGALAWVLVIGLIVATVWFS